MGHTTETSGLFAQYKVEVPPNWNGTLLLYSHGYNSFTVPVLPPDDAGDPATEAYLLSQGYALAGSAYARAGWSLEQAFQDQIALLDAFGNSQFGSGLKRTIAWGHSLGGMITAGLVQLYPDRFVGALPMCGVVAGGLGVWNQGLDSEFALATLQTPIKMVGFSGAFDTFLSYNQAIAAINAAQLTPEGRARIALSAALADVPGWVDPASPEPASTDFAAQEVNQLAWDNNIDFLFAYFGRAELEARSGGNFSWNTGVDYRVQLSHSIDLAEVKALYAAAGLDLNADLNKLNAATRIAADPGAVSYVQKFITYNGQLQIPVLTMHTTGDGLVEVTDENAYASVVRSAGDNSMLRQVFVHRAGHCTFTPAETFTALQTLLHRVDTGRWEDSTSPASMNSQATGLGSALNSAPASFIDFHPDKFLRPFDARDVAA